MKTIRTDRLSVWPEYASGMWIVSENQAGTNNELVLGQFYEQELAENFFNLCKKNGAVC